MTNKFNPNIPLYIMHTPDIETDEKQAAIEALVKIGEIADVKIPLIDEGVWRDINYQEKGNLLPHRSIDWYIDKWYNENRKQIDAERSINELWDDPYTLKNPHYDLILTNRDLYARELSFIVGVAIPQRGAIISFNRFREIKDKSMRLEIVKQEIYHEIGHVFGLPNPNSAFVEDILGWHCINECAMKQGLVVPRDQIDSVKERLETGEIYCNYCTKELKKYFQERSTS